MSPFDTPNDPYYAPKYVWEARGALAPNDHTDWDIVETYTARHRRLDTMDPKWALAWEDDPELVAEYLAHTPRHRAAS